MPEVLPLPPQSESLSAVRETQPLLVGAASAARLCGISPATWFRLAAAGKIGPEPRKLGARRLYLRSELEEWVAACMPDGSLPDRHTWATLRKGRGHRG